MSCTCPATLVALGFILFYLHHLSNAFLSIFNKLQFYFILVDPEILFSAVCLRIQFYLNQGPRMLRELLGLLA